MTFPSTQIASPPQALAEVIVNEALGTLTHASVLGQRQATTTGLTWGYYGGLWGGATVADGTVALTNAATNHVVVLRSSGAVSVSTATTNWNNTALYGRLYRLTTAGSVVTVIEDHRCGPFGAFAEVRHAHVTLTDAATIAIDAGLAQRVKAAELVIAGNRTLGNPSNLVDGAQIVIPIKQDATGSRTLAYASLWKFPGGAPVLSTAANARDLITGVYDVGTATIFGRLEKAYA